MTSLALNEKDKKNYWAIGIIISYVCFMSMILTLVFMSTGQQPELVSDDYYKKGVGYQNTIDARKNAEALPLKPVLNQHKMLVEIPAKISEDFFNGKLLLLRPNNKNMDQEINIENSLEIALPDLQSGAWQLSLHWEDAQKKQYNIEWNIYR